MDSVLWLTEAIYRLDHKIWSILGVIHSEPKIDQTPGWGEEGELIDPDRGGSRPGGRGE